MKAIYFKSDKDVSSTYLIELGERRSWRVTVDIYKMLSFPIEFSELKTGDTFNGDPLEYDLEHVCSLNLCPKYFFPVFSSDMQLYYDEEKYYEGKSKTDSIASLMECVNYAIEIGLEYGGIKPY